MCIEEEAYEGNIEYRKHGLRFHWKATLQGLQTCTIEAITKRT